MIYPSHWSNGDFGLQAPDTEPYKTVNRYIQKENSLLDTLGKDKPISRPWIQDFTASYLGAGNYIDYDAKAISEEVQALKDNGLMNSYYGMQVMIIQKVLIIILKR